VTHELITQQVITTARSTVFEKLFSESVRLILIKGPPGIGKTTLISGLLDYVGSATYISTRVGLGKLSKQNLRLRKLENKGQFDQISLESASVNYQDMRMGNPSIILQEVSRAAASRELIILDSWDTMAKEIDRVERLRAEKSIAAIIDASHSRLVFVSEEPELTSTDYLVDAIISLRYQEVAGRRLREIVWDKLRGAPIENQRGIYTLDGGRFKVLQKPVLAGRHQKKLVPIPNTPTHYSTGSKDFDTFLGGGIKKGALIVVEVGDTVGSDWHRPLYVGMRCNFILNGGACITVPANPITPEMVISGTVPYAGEKLTKSRLRVMSYVSSARHPSVVDVRGLSAEDEFEIQERVARRLKRGNRPILWILSMDTYETFAGGEQKSLADFMARGTAMIRESGDATIMLAKPSTYNIQKLSDNCDLHLKIEEKDGQMLLYAKRPPTEIYGLNYDFSMGFPSVTLAKVM
jgi:KaiC/GvpD/RAD55 family RecA-like ATPase